VPGYDRIVPPGHYSSLSRGGSPGLTAISVDPAQLEGIKDVQRAVRPQTPNAKRQTPNAKRNSLARIPESVSIQSQVLDLATAE
jgi:hypothetical protein